MSALLDSWRFDPWLSLALVATAAVYLRGWRRLRAQMPARFTLGRAAAFHAGLAALYVAAASPLDAFAGLLLQVHMAQHLLLMTAAPALLLLGAPAVPLLRGLPAALVRGLTPFLVAPEIGRLGSALSHPATGFAAMAAATWLWHLPGPYETALLSPFWHGVEHATFFGAGLLFWWPVVQPWPSRARWPRWTMPVYLLLADVQNTALSAIFVFSERVLYPHYETVPRLGGLSAAADQVAAGVLMWVPMSLAYLVPAAAITVRLLSPRPRADARPPDWRAMTAAAERREALDLLRLPVVGALLRSAGVRRGLQAAMLLLAAAIVADGILGPQMSPMNLAGVLPWTYWRGFTVIALLAAGNFFCMACPFTLPRALARRLGWQGGWSWPRRLRSKVPALVLLLVFFWAYEALALWDSPRATAILIAAYFAAALAVDTAFRGASFCRFVCPIGQFHFVHSLVSPLEVRVRQPSACAGCTTHDCLRGNERQRGCETELFLPRKAGSVDCTFCLDCVRACPRDNVGLVAVAPASVLWRGDGAASARPRWGLDLGILALALTAASVVTAAAMVAPVQEALRRAAPMLGTGSGATALFALGAIAATAAALAGAIALGRRLSGAAIEPRDLVVGLALALVPLGASVWAAHFGFHLLSGWWSAVPVLARAAADVGLAAAPSWTAPPALLGAESMLGLEVLLLDVGLLATLYAGWRAATSRTGTRRAAVALLSPWLAVTVCLYLASVWVFLQPMEMRGLMVH